MTTKNLQKTILDAIEEGLAALGESPKQAILFHLESTFKLRREEIPKNLTEFKKALEKIFGPGTPYVERLILEKLYGKLNLLSRNEHLDLLNGVDFLRRHFSHLGGA